MCLLSEDLFPGDEVQDLDKIIYIIPFYLVGLQKSIERLLVHTLQSSHALLVCRNKITPYEQKCICQNRKSLRLILHCVKILIHISKKITVILVYGIFIIEVSVSISAGHTLWHESAFEQPAAKCFLYCLTVPLPSAD